MRRRAPTLAFLAAMGLAGLLPVGAAAETALPLPNTMAAVGDSITQAASSAGSLGSDAPQNSWSTGTSTSVNSHYLRLLAIGAPISGENHNGSVSGAKMANLTAQMQGAATLQPDYLTVLIGGNDLCTDTVAQMTAVTDFRAQFETALTTLETASPATNVYVVSIPDVYQLWNLFKNNLVARFVWASADICQSLLANPGSTKEADVQRRAAVRQRNIDYNTQLQQECAEHARCRFDGNAVFNTAFTTGDVSGDYFHPSVQGQAKLASVSWAAGYRWDATMTVGQLASSTSVARNTWTAKVAILVINGAGSPVSGATVSTTWTVGTADTCTTDADGRCTVTSDSFNKRKVGSVTLTVTGVTHSVLAYESSLTTITVTRP